MTILETGNTRPQRSKDCVSERTEDHSGVNSAGPGATSAGQSISQSRARRSIPYLLCVAFFAIFAIVSVNRHRQLRTTGFDLGIFEQAIRSYANLNLPVSELKGRGYNLLGDHFHPILALLAPFYRVFPSPITLLVAQALLIAISVIPISQLAISRFGPWLGASVGAAYGLSWGLQHTIGFDFHEICFAVPLVAFSLVRLAERRWVAAVAFAAPLVLVKEDLPLTIAAIGVYLFLVGQRRLGAAVTAAGASAAALIVLEVIPAFNISGHNDYLPTVTPTTEDPFSRLFASADLKALTIVALLVPTAMLALRSPLLLIAVPTLLWRFWSTTSNYWVPHFHYDAILMPIVFVSFLDALDRLAPRFTGRLRLAGKAVIVGSLAIAVLWTGRLPVAELVKPQAWQISPRVAAIDQLLARIPNNAIVAAPNDLAPQLTHRTTVYLFPSYPDQNVQCDWVLIDEKAKMQLPADHRSSRVTELTTTGGYRQVASAQHVLLLWRVH